MFDSIHSYHIMNQSHLHPTRSPHRYPTSNPSILFSTRLSTTQPNSQSYSHNLKSPYYSPPLLSQSSQLSLAMFERTTNPKPRFHSIATKSSHLMNLANSTSIPTIHIILYFVLLLQHYPMLTELCKIHSKQLYFIVWNLSLISSKVQDYQNGFDSSTQFT